jgi:hypothetical protein
MAYGGDETTQRDSGPGQWFTWLFEKLGVLNKGSSATSAAPDPGEVDQQVQAVSTNALNVTRVGGLATLVTAVGAAALAIFKLDKGTTPAARAAAYASVGVIVAAALIAAAVIIAADIRARTAVATTTSAKAAPAPAARTAVKSLAGTAAAAATKATLDQAYDYVLANADEGSLDVTLPSPVANAWRHMTIRRTDSNAGHRVNVQPAEGIGATALAPGESLSLYATDAAWHSL